MIKDFCKKNASSCKSLPYLPGFRNLPCCNMTKLCIHAHVHKKILPPFIPGFGYAYMHTCTKKIILPVVPGFGIDVAMPYQINVSHC